MPRTPPQPYVPPLRRSRPRSPKGGRIERQRVAEATAVQLREWGVRLTGRETVGNLQALLDAFGRFSEAIERRSANLAPDDVVSGATPLVPDVAAYLLPARRRRESVAAFLARIDAMSTFERHPPAVRHEAHD